jgi:hypothetical protein
MRWPDRLIRKILLDTEIAGNVLLPDVAAYHAGAEIRLFKTLVKSDYLSPIPNF